MYVLTGFSVGRGPKGGGGGGGLGCCCWEPFLYYIFNKEQICFMLILTICLCNCKYEMFYNKGYNKILKFFDFVSMRVHASGMPDFNLSGIHSYLL